MRQFRAIAARLATSTAFWFTTGRAPGKPRHTGQTLLLGGSPKRVEQPQKIFVRVSSWTWTSKPITVSYLARTSGASDAASGVDSAIAERRLYQSAGRTKVRRYDALAEDAALDRASELSYSRWQALP